MRARIHPHVLSYTYLSMYGRSYTFEMFWRELEGREVLGIGFVLLVTTSFVPRCSTLRLLNSVIAGHSAHFFCMRSPPVPRRHRKRQTLRQLSGTISSPLFMLTAKWSRSSRARQLKRFDRSPTVRILAAATKQGRRLFRSALLEVRLLFEGGH